LRVLIIDNYDSFVYNLAQAIGSLEAAPLVYRNDQITLEEARALEPDAIIISPGPGSPRSRRFFGVCREVILELGRHIPLLGVCLGHQGIIYHFGGRVVRAKNLMHGKVSLIIHDGQTIYEGVQNPFEATRYHSLVGDPRSLPRDLEVSAFSRDGEIMGVRHRRYPIEGVQFHPESVLTREGMKILRNFLRGARR
jgi:anthranilate synthase component 2